MAKLAAKKSTPLGTNGKKSTRAAAKEAAAALKSATSSKPATAKVRKKPGPKPGSKRSAITAAGTPRKKPGPKPGSKRSALTAAGKPRKKPGPKATVKNRITKKAVVKRTVVKKIAAKKPAAKETATKKPIAQKPAIKRAVVKKTAPAKAVVAKKPTTKKTVAKKPVVKRAVVKTAGPIKVQKTPAPKRVAVALKPALKPALRKPAPTQHIATLRTRIDNIQARLERSDAQTRKNINTLERAFTTLQAKVGVGSTEFSEQVSLLSGKIENITASAHADVGAALNDALVDSTADNLTAALTRAEQRLVAAETAQSASIAKVNRHIADMALAIDARFKKEARVNADAISHLGNRITTVEAESAVAISNLGDKVIAISGEFGQRAEDSEAIIKEKISEIALKTQEEFEQFRANLERRIDTLTNEQDQASANLDKAMQGLSSRVEGLEHIASNTAMTALSNTETRAYPSAVTPNAPIPMLEDNDAFAPEPLHEPSAQIVPPNPYAVPEPTPILNEIEAHIPQEFDPATFIQGSAGGSQIPAPTNLQAPTPIPAALIATSALATENKGASYETPMPDPVSAPELSLPYADPAYAETPAPTPYDQAMNHARPGNFGAEKKRLALPKLNMTPRNMKVAGLALGIAIVGLVGVKALSGDSEPNTIMAENSITRDLDTAPGRIVSVPPTSMNDPSIIETTAPTIGEYADNRVDIAPMGSPEAVTLEAAALAGDPVAQYQMGVSYLENGRTEDAVRLIRLASDNRQPAAQYRLAKLYETGEGVAQNPGMARQLTERAARNGNRIAMHDLALYHAEGRGGVKMDLDTAAKWFEKAAERGVVDSQFNLGVMYETGKGVPKNLTDAFVWYSVAAAQGDQFAKERVGVLETQMDSTLVAAAQTRAKQFTPSKIDQAANGIFNNLPWNTQKKAATATASDPRVKDVQVMLIGLGFDTGGVDGAVGPKTRTAIAGFQKANNLPETGQVDDTLVDRLEFASGA